MISSLFPRKTRLLDFWLIVYEMRIDGYEDYLRCVFERDPYAKTENDWENLLPWNIEITPFKMRGEWVD